MKRGHRAQGKQLREEERPGKRERGAGGEGKEVQNERDQRAKKGEPRA